MKLVTYCYQEAERIGIVCGDSIVPLASLGVFKDTMLDFIRTTGPDKLRCLSTMAEMASEEDRIPLSEVTLEAPIPVPAQDILCLGINYMDHAAESARYKHEEFDGKREMAVYFGKRVDRAIGHRAEIPLHADITSKLDYEVELAVVIGKDAYHVRPEDAAQYIFGYTILNDVSARDVQHSHNQWYFGKSLAGFCPMGPWIVTADEIVYPPVLPIRSYVNGELRQNSHTGLLIFDIAYIISELSSGMVLKAGTVISTGTPSGVGMGMNPPQFLKTGDTVVCEIEGIGRLSNTVGE
ncbi:MAG: fumarylacetoacetate hydrolase family protein [Firmicutes bacterium]|nr:fumarylacetoacetate hydrolase family protein [Bacillota bacterium]